MYDGERLHGVLASVWLQVCAVLIYLFLVCGGFPGVSAIKNPPAMQETWVPSLGREDPLGKELATYSSIFAW